MSPLQIALIAFGYILGAVPFGVVISKMFYRIDIREHGSKNPGATNMWRTLGRKPGIATLFLDIVKGAIPVAAANFFFAGDQRVAVGAGLAAILGHNWSIFLKGKGGKGVATSAGVFLALMPKHIGVALVFFLIFFLSTKRVSVGSMAAALALIATTFVFETAPLLQIIVVLASLMVVIKHASNIRRLIRGEEPKVNI